MYKKVQFLKISKKRKKENAVKEIIKIIKTEGMEWVSIGDKAAIYYCS